jgi:microcompartment protein CcmK/EutM
MTFGRVIGSLVSTIKHPAYDGQKLLLVQPLDENGNKNGTTTVCIDAAGVGAGELVLVCREGSAIRQVLQLEHCPVRSMVIGVIDSIDFADGSSLSLADVHT